MWHDKSTSVSERFFRSALCVKMVSRWVSVHGRKREYGWRSERCLVVSLCFVAWCTVAVTEAKGRETWHLLIWGE